MPPGLGDRRSREIGGHGGAAKSDIKVAEKASTQSRSAPEKKAAKKRQKAAEESGGKTRRSAQSRSAPPVSRGPGGASALGHVSVSGRIVFWPVNAPPGAVRLKSEISPISELVSESDC